MNVPHLRKSIAAAWPGASGESGFDGGSGGGGSSEVPDTLDRLKRLEECALHARDRMARVEVRLEHNATHDDVSRLEATLLKWFMATATAIAGLAFAAAKLIH